MKIIGEKINGTRKAVSKAIAQRDENFIASLAMGMDSAIIDPTNTGMRETIFAAQLILGQGQALLELYTGIPNRVDRKIIPGQPVNQNNKHWVRHLCFNLFENWNKWGNAMTLNTIRAFKEAVNA